MRFSHDYTRNVMEHYGSSRYCNYFYTIVCAMGELKMKERVIFLSISVVILTMLWVNQTKMCIDYTYHGHEVEVQQ